MSDKWEVYFAPVDDEPAAILVDLGIAESAPDPERPILLWVWLQMRAPDDNGFASEEEETQLTQIEDSFIDAVEMTTDAILVGRVTTCGRREFYFYSQSTEGFDDTIAEAMESFDEYEYETGSQEDDEWDQYFQVLFPGPEDTQQIFNRQVIDKLSENGDPLTVPRAVDHYATFRSPEERSQFIEALGPDYRVINQQFRDEPDTERPYGVELQRVSAVDFETIDDITMDLLETARRFDGDYEGWGSHIVTE